MKNRRKQEKLLVYKILFTVIVVAVYLIGKSLPLHMVDVSVYTQQGINAEDILLQAINGDIHQCSLFALGISPYISASILVMIITAFRSSEAKARTSSKKQNRNKILLTLFFAVFMAVTQVPNLSFTVSGDMLTFVRIIVVFQMVTGAMMIVWLASLNKRYGIGGQSALIFINIFDGIYASLEGQNPSDLLIPLLLSVMAILVMAIMENTERRIPVQRISIHNIYADKNYLAIKMNPIGVMPVMFAMSVFMLPQLLVSFMMDFFPDCVELAWLNQNLMLTKPFGICIYICILFLLNIGFSRVFLNPKELTEQFLKSGDCIQNVHAGRDTKRYLSRTITGLAFLSSTIMAVCLSLPLLLQMTGQVDSTLSALPTSVMMITGLFCNLAREIFAVKHLEAYKPFI